MVKDLGRYETKIKTFNKLINFVETARDLDKKIVQCHGCFDIVHPGHIHHLFWASKQGDRLIVTITGDEYITKGNGRPYFNEHLRAQQLAAIAFVDVVYVNHAFDASSILATIQPDFYLKGAEYQLQPTAALLQEKGIVESYGGELLFSLPDVVFSSSEIGMRLFDYPRNKAFVVFLL